MIEIKLKPCPFCGGKAKVEQQGTRSRSHIISCEYCHATLETGEVFNAGEKWNERYAPLLTRAEFTAAEIRGAERIIAAMENSAVMTRKFDKDVCILSYGRGFETAIAAAKSELKILNSQTVKNKA